MNCICKYLDYTHHKGDPVCTNPGRRQGLYISREFVNMVCINTSAEQCPLQTTEDVGLDDDAINFRRREWFRVL